MLISYMYHRTKTDQLATEYATISVPSINKSLVLNLRSKRFLLGNWLASALSYTYGCITCKVTSNSKSITPI